MHADRTNRVMLVVLALLLIAVGGASLAASFGTLGGAVQHRPLSVNRVGTFISDNGDWLWPLIAVIAGAVVLFALRWLLALLVSTDRLGDLNVAAQPGMGTTTLDTGALTDAVAAEIRTYQGVDSARARMIGDPEAPNLVVDATLEADADFTTVRDRIQNQALTNARTALADPGLPIRLNLTVGSSHKVTRVS